MKITRNLFLAGVFGLATLLVAGCFKKDPAETVRQRALERWDLLVGRHGVKAYDYLSPGYRTTHTLEQYVAFVATARLQWKSAVVDSVQCEEDVCTARLTVTSSVPGTLLRLPKDLESTGPVTEKWVRSDGQWYFLPDSRISGEELSKEAGGEKDKPESVPAAADAAAPAASGPVQEKEKKNN